MRAASLTFMVQNVPEQGVKDVMELNSFHSRVIARPRTLPAVRDSGEIVGRSLQIIILIWRTIEESGRTSKVETRKTTRFNSESSTKSFLQRILRLTPSPRGFSTERLL